MEQVFCRYLKSSVNSHETYTFMKSEEIIIANTVQFVQKKLQHDCSGHDWGHIYRVWKLALYIGVSEGADKYVIQLAALLHDISDWKFQKDKNAYEEIKTWLTSQQAPENLIRHVCLIAEHISFKGANVPDRIRTHEGKIVQDADRLDAIGAIGIGRAFAFGGFKGHIMHNPDIEPVFHNNFEEYQQKQSTTINHFYEKLLLLKDRMHTETAKQLAVERHKYLEEYLKRFLKEWSV